MGHCLYMKNTEVLKSLIFMSQAKKVMRHGDKRAPGKMQEYMVEQGLGVASNSSPLTICCTAPFFFSQTHNNQKTVFLCRQTTTPGRWLVLPTVSTKYCREDLTPATWKSYGHYWLNTVYQILLLFRKMTIHCAGFSWDRLKFLPSSWYSTVFWI